jgi:hypothetical protein
VICSPLIGLKIADMEQKGYSIHIFSWPVEAEGGTSLAAPAGWLFWNLIAHPLLGEEDSTSQPRWLSTAARIDVH